ncbi:hypothetical protein [Rosistilla oblonga]|uniref:hypothetical protein n=1 Tax=Rosistilla oblonga TaxID=2527990 RepID=UPI003A97ED6A
MLFTASGTSSVSLVVDISAVAAGGTTSPTQNNSPGSCLMIAYPKKRDTADEFLNHQPCLTFTPYCMAKLLFFRDAGETCVGAFGVAATGDPMRLVDVALPCQVCTPSAIELTDEELSTLEEQAQRASSSSSSSYHHWIELKPRAETPVRETAGALTDQLNAAFNWRTHSVLARGDETKAKLVASVGPRCEQELKVAIDFARPFSGSLHEAWLREYESMVRIHDPFDDTIRYSSHDPAAVTGAAWSRSEWVAS